MKSWHKASILFLLALVLSAQTVSTGDKMHVRLRAIGEKLKCQCGCSYTVGSCNMLNCHFKSEVDAQISADLGAGADEASILGKLKEKYGTLVLAAPPAEGFNLVGWLMPFIGLVVGLIAVRYILIRWRRPRPALGGAPAASGALVEKFRDQMEKELADLE
ncbi:MAG: cytochrome c-type biogenesis protein CcmH [Acidobacteria bacterium]|nr:cytochrome c-type biogenesis protein CcmH [Acidobacteriota bacterium]